MPLGTWLRAGTSAAALVLGMAGTATAAPAPAPAPAPASTASTAQAAVVTLRYDDSRAAGFGSPRSRQESPRGTRT